MVAPTETAQFDSITMIGQEIPDIESRINELPTNRATAETRAKLDALKVSVNKSTNIDQETLRAGIDAIKYEVDLLQKLALEEKKIKEILSNLSPEKFESAVTMTESLIKIFADNQHQPLLRSYAGSLMLEQLEKRNHRLVIKSDNTIDVEFINKSQSNPSLAQNKIELATKINALVSNGSLSLDTLRSGMLFRAESFAIYSKDIRDSSGVNILNPEKAKNPKAYFDYLRDKQNAGYKISTDEETLQNSESWFDNFSGMTQTILDMKDFGQLARVSQEAFSPIRKAKKAEFFTTDISNNPNSPATAVGEGIGEVGGVVGKIAGASARGGISVLSDTLRAASKEGGAWGTLAVLGGLIAAIWNFGFLNTLKGVFGIGLVSEMAAGRVDIDVKKWIDKVKKWIDKASTTVGALAWDITIPAGLMGESLETQKHSPSQEKATEKVKQHTDISRLIETNGKINPDRKATTDDYLNFINSAEFQQQWLEHILFTKNPESSIFTNSKRFDLNMRIPPNLDPVLLKKVLRIYLSENLGLTDPVGNTKEWDKEKTWFLKSQKITSEAHKNLTFNQLIQKVYGKNIEN